MKRKQRPSDELIALFWVMLPVAIMMLVAMIGGIFLLPLFSGV